MNVCRLAGQTAGFGQHLGRRINRHHFAGEWSEVAGERARTATKIEHAMMGAKAGDLGDAADQRRCVRHPASLVVRRGGAVALRVERCVGHRRISLAVGAAVPHIATVDIGGERRMIALAWIAVAAATRRAERDGVALVDDVLLLGIGLLAVD
jgi:hypothetical protein